MARKFPTPGGFDRIFDCVVVFFFGAVLCWLGVSGLVGGPDSATTALSVVFLLLGLVFLPGAVLLWLKVSWARIPVAALLGLASLGKVVGLVTKGFSWRQALYAVSLGWIALDVWRLFSPQKLAEDAPENPEDSKPMTSVVLLLRRSRFLDANGLSTYLKSAWGQEFSTRSDTDESKPKDAPGPEWYVVGQSPIFMVGTPHGMFTVHNHDRTYFNDQKGAADEIKDLRSRKAVLDSRAWLSVDYLGGSFTDRKEAYPWIMKAISEISGPEATALFLPEEGRLLPWNDGLETKLKSADVYQLFSEIEQPLVVPVASGDAALLAAKEEAHRRWPEFVDSFNRKDGEGFSVKAPITRGETTEHIWIEVDALDSAKVMGRLGNDPVDLDGLRLGSRVEVPVEDVEDWAILKGDKPVGLFSLDAVQNAYSGKDDKDGEPRQ